MEITYCRPIFYFLQLIFKAEHFDAVGNISTMACYLAELFTIYLLWEKVLNEASLTLEGVTIHDCQSCHWLTL